MYKQINPFVSIVIAYLINLFVYTLIINTSLTNESSIIVFFVIGLCLLTFEKTLRNTNINELLPSSIRLGSLIILISGCINGAILLGDKFKLSFIGVIIYILVKMST